MVPAFIFLAGLTGLLVAGHALIDGATRIGTTIGLPPTVVGLTLVAAGTSAPELAVFYQAIRADDTELAVGSIIGSNIANVLLVLGTVASIGAIRVAQRVVRIDLPAMILASVALLLLAGDGVLDRLEGVALLAGLIVFVIAVLRNNARTQPVQSATTDDADPPRPSLIRPLVAIVAGVAGLAVAAGYVVEGAERIAIAIGVPELIVGLTVVALGTSAPEIATSLIAALRGNRQLALGNAVGSNIFNILLVLGVSGLLAPAGVAFSQDAVRLDLPILVAAAIACLPIIFWDRTLDRWEGALFVVFYLAYLAFLVLDGTDRLVADPLAVAIGVFVAPLGALTLLVGLAKQRAKRKDHPTTAEH
jgi:cation:H+ antiporter